MRTPAGNECKYFYGDYYRGRNLEECRLLKGSGYRWEPNLCKTCPVPGITIANACEFMRIKASVARPILSGFQKRVQVTAWCEKTERVVDEPQIGCGECHSLPFNFEIKK
jgi:hypothetical protein